MPYFVKVGDKEISFDDLPLKVWADVERALRASGVDKGWLAVYSAPGEYVGGLEAVLRAAAKHLGVELPDVLTAKHAATAFRWVKDDDLPDVWEDGSPSPEGGPTTG